MSLKVIGSGFGRTGTMSTKLALEELGFGPCHHMVEVMQNPGQPAHWAAIARGEEPDWAEVFDGYAAQIDNPGAVFWHELSIAFPDAKIIHTERPEEDWWASYDYTINRFWQNRKNIALPPAVQSVFEDMDKILHQGSDAGLDRETAIASYRANNAKVREVIPANKLLVFNPIDGWEPLCRFLEVAIRTSEFPRSNARSEFWSLFGGEPVVR
ncbi:MAG: sulfotransferase family protein [Pseudomonadota bacterium]